MACGRGFSQSAARALAAMIRTSTRTELRLASPPRAALSQPKSIVCPLFFFRPCVQEERGGAKQTPRPVVRSN